MSFAYEFSKRASKQFRQLDPWLAEETLDELESLVSHVPQRRRYSPTGEVFDFVRKHGGDTVYVFLTVKIQPRRKVLRVTSIGSFVRQP